MVIKQKQRNEIDATYKWDLTTLYPSIEAWYADYALVEREMPLIDKYKTTLMDSANNLYEFLVLDNKLERILDKLVTYAHLHNDEDTSVALYQELLGKASNLFDKFAEKETFFEPLLLKYDYTVIEDFYKQNPRLKEYQFVLENYFRYKSHHLNDHEEWMISALNKSFRIPEETYEKLTDTDMTFGIITNEDGKKVELTNSNYAIYIRSKKRSVRRQAFKMLYKSYSNFRNTIASTYAGDVNTANSLARIYNFDNALESSLYSDKINIEVYNNLIRTVNSKLPVIYKYLKMRKKILGLANQHMYDTYADLISNESKAYSFLEAKDTVINALRVLGEDYVNILNKAFEEKWIDVYNNRGKRGGAYSGGCFDSNPFILLNFEGKLNDVSTLAHELGHSIHSYYSHTSNPYQYAHYTIFVAEVASTVNELLLANYLLTTSTDNNEKLVILNNLLELYKSTIFRQTMFAEFERDMMESNIKGEILTNEFIANHYYALVKKYFGDSVVIDEDIKYEWSRIPHFYYNFYVYKYATGLASATYIVNRILSGEDNAIEDYKSFLKTGGKMYPLEELKIAGVDMSDEKVILSAIKTFEDKIEEFEKLYSLTVK